MDAECGRRFLIIVNPAAGRGRAADLAEQVQDRLRIHGASCCMERSTRRGEAESIARHALAHDAPDLTSPLCVVACGGDGTVQEIVNAIVGSTPSERSGPQQSRSKPRGHGVLGLAPAGRCNDFASAFGLRPDADRIAEVLLTGRQQPVDLGRVGDRFFCTVAALGFDAAVSRFVNDMKLPLRGTWAYVYGVLRVLMRYKPIQVRMMFDDLSNDRSGLIRDSSYEGPVFLAASANTPTYGGRMRIAPQADATDGKLDICLVSPLCRRRVVRLLRRVMGGRHADLPEVHMIRCRSLRLESTHRHEIWADGEFITHTPAKIELIAGAVNVIMKDV